jgi:hypothetical protein
MKAWSLLLAILLAGCGSTAASLTYTPTETVQPQAAPMVGTVTVVDQRGESDPNYVGVIRGGFGNPLKTLTSDRPVRDEVASAFIAGLQARGLYDPAGPDTLTITLTEFSSDQYHRREARVGFTLVLTRRGQPLYQRTETVDKINGSMVTFDTGVFASIDDLRAITDQALSQAVDQALDRPGFLAAIRGR